MSVKSYEYVTLEIEPPSTPRIILPGGLDFKLDETEDEAMLVAEHLDALYGRLSRSVPDASQKR